MTPPSHLRSLFAFGTFFVLGGAWLVLVTTVRMQSLRTDSSAAYAATVTGRPMSTLPPTIPYSNVAIGIRVDR
jgi:hypothetical protein